MNTFSLLKGLRFVDSFFPSGGYAFSSGLEAAVQGGAVRNTEELSRYVVESLTTGMGEREAVTVGIAHEAYVSGVLETAFNADQVQKLILARDFDQAERICEGLIAEATDNVEQKKTALHLLGTSRYMQGQVASSIECFKTILSLDPKHTDAAISLSVIYNDIGRYEEAKKIYQIANQSLQLKRQGSDRLLDRKFALKHIELGDLYFKYHRYDDALDDYSKASRLDPQQLETRIKLAKVYAKKGFTTRAIQELQQLCHEHPGFIAGRLHLGLMYYSQGNIIDAQLEWERARDQEPANQEIQTYLEMAKHATETSI